MIKKLFVIALFTGFAHLSTIIVLRNLSQHVPPEIISTIGQLDALINLMLSIIAGGLLMTSVRDIAISENWKEHLISSQQARFTLSLLLLFFIFLGFGNPVYFFFLGAPLLALNADYALYGKGFPVFASFLAFVRTFVPFILLYISSVYWPSYAIEIFGLSSLAIYLLSGVIISSYLQVPYVVKLSLKSLKSYVHSLPLAVVSFGYYFLGLGILIVAEYFYPASQLAVTYLVLKLYVIFKGVLRILNQTFISEMKMDDMCHHVDRISFIIGFLIFIIVSLFPGSFRDIIINTSSDTDGQAWIYLLALCCLLVAPFVSFTTKAILEKKDHSYFRISLLAIGVSSISSIFLSYVLPAETGILISLIAGELICILGLIILLNKKSWLVLRARFLTQNLPLAIIPFLPRVIGGDTLYMLITAAFLFSIALVINNKASFGFKLSLPG